MRKHVLGFGIFNLIFASFALVYAFFYAPAIPPKETVKPPIAQTEIPVERPYTCQLKRNKISFEVQSSEFDLDKSQLTSKIKVTWNGNGEPPKQIFLKSELFTLDQRGTSKTLEPLVFATVFDKRSETTLIVFSKVGKSSKIDERQNLYVAFDLSENELSEVQSKVNKNIAEASQVLFVHKVAKY